MTTSLEGRGWSGRGAMGELVGLMVAKEEQEEMGERKERVFFSHNSLNLVISSFKYMSIAICAHSYIYILYVYTHSSIYSMYIDSNVEAIYWSVSVGDCMYFRHASPSARGFVRKRWVGGWAVFFIFTDL